MTTIMRFLYDTLKIFIVFIICTALFFYVIKAVHQEYQNLDKYNIPNGNTVKVMQQNDDNDVWERLSIFFRLGE